MPKVASTRYEELTQKYEDTISKAMRSKSIKQEDIAKRLNKNQSSISRKMQDIDRITFGEMRSILSFLGLEFQIKEKGK